MTRILCFLAAGALLLSGCKTDTPIEAEPQINGADYYPLKTGNYLIYQVTETRQLGETGTPVVTSFQIRERVDSLFTDLSGEPYYRVIRSIRSGATASWADDSVLTVKKTSYGIERQENNFKQIKLAFPVYKNRSWNANLVNPNQEENWTYTEVAVPYTLSLPSGDTTYQNTILVKQADEVNQVDVDQRWERYALDVGMIESLHYTEFRTQIDNTGPYVLQQSFRREEKLLESGHE